MELAGRKAVSLADDDPSYDDCFSCRVSFSQVEKWYTTTKRKLGVTDQAVADNGAVLSSCSGDVGSFLPRLCRSLADRKSKEVKREVRFTFNAQCAFPDESAIVFSAHKISLQKKEHR